MKRKRPRWTQQEIDYLRAYIPTRGAKWVAENMPTRTYNAISAKASELGIFLGETHAYKRKKIMFTVDVAAKADVPISLVYTAIRRADIKVVEFGDEGNNRGRRIAVPSAWAKEFIKEQRQLRNNAREYAHWWSIEKAAALLGVDQTTLKFWAQGKKASNLAIKPRAVLVIDDVAPRRYLFCPEDIEVIKKQFDEHRTLVSHWVPLKNLEIEAGVGKSAMQRMASKLGQPKKLYGFHLWRLYVSPEEAQKIRDYYGIRKAA